MHEPISPSLRTSIADITDPAVRHVLPDTALRQQHVLHRDYETRGQLLLKRVGTHRYAADPGTEVSCCAFAVDDEPVQLWIPGDPVPPEFIEAAADPSWIVCAHNDAFEAAIEHHGAASWLAGNSVGAAPLHDGRSICAWIAGAVEHGSRCARASKPQRCCR
jgi:hypothetical protein